MSKKKGTDITKVGNMDLAVTPDFMAGQDTGTELIKQYVTPPRLKIVQKQAGEELLDMFSEGSVIVTPNNIEVLTMPVTNKGRPIPDEIGSFCFTPLYFYPEWCAWNPIESKGTLPMIRERSTDPQSEVAMKAKTPHLRKEKIDDVEVRNVEHLNFIIKLLDDEHPLRDDPIIMSFQRGSHGVGRHLCSLIRQRKAPLFGCVFQATVQKAPSSEWDYWQFVVTNPDGDVAPWVSKDAYDVLQPIHEEMRRLHQSNLIRADYEESATEAVPTGDEEF